VACQRDFLSFLTFILKPRVNHINKGIHDENEKGLRMSEVTIASRSRDSAQPMGMHVSYEL